MCKKVSKCKKGKSNTSNLHFLVIPPIKDKETLNVYSRFDNSILYGLLGISFFGRLLTLFVVRVPKNSWLLVASQFSTVEPLFYVPKENGTDERFFPFFFPKKWDSFRFTSFKVYNRYRYTFY